MLAIGGVYTAPQVVGRTSKFGLVVSYIEVAGRSGVWVDACVFPRGRQRLMLG